MIRLICTVRDCREPLERNPRQWVCPRGHAFDIARSGYCNLLQPNERRSRQPGDSPDAARARRRLLDRGIGATFVSTIAELAAELDATGPVLDVGCGEGSHLAAFCRRLGAEGLGIDISSPAIELAAKRQPQLTWVVANLDRTIPVADGSIGTLLSITAKANPDEFARVLRAEGLMIVVIPGPDDLVELRERVLGERRPLARVPDSDPAVDPRFAIVRRFELKETIDADAPTIADLLVSTYRGQRRSQAGAAGALDRLTITQSRVVTVCRALTGSP